MEIKYLLLSFLFISLDLIADKIVADKIIAIIYHGDGSSLILQSDLKRGFGGPKTLDQEISARLMALDAQKLKVTITDAELETQIAQLQKQNNFTADDVKNIFKQDGLTEQEGREELRKNFLVRKIIGYRVEDRISVTTKEVEDDYIKNPSYLPGKYTVRQAFVPFIGSSRSIKKALINREIESGSIMNSVKWDPKITLESDQVSPDMLGKIQDLDTNSVIILDDASDGITLLHLVNKIDKSLVPLEEKKGDIRMKLMQEQYEIYMKEYEEKLLKEARIKILG